MRAKRATYFGQMSKLDIIGFSRHKGFVKIRKVCQIMKVLSMCQWFVKIKGFLNLAMVCQCIKGLSCQITKGFLIHRVCQN